MSSKLVFKTGNWIIQTGNGIISPTSRPLIKNFFCNISSILTKEFKIGFQNRKWNHLNRKWNYFSRFQVSDHKTSFTTSYPYEPKRLNIGFQNRKWNYPNRKWDYFSQFWASDQKTSFTTSSPYLPTNTKLILKTGNVIIATLGSILDSQLDWKSFKFQLARWSLREAELRREPHPPTTYPTTTHPPPNLRYRNFSPIWCRLPTLE